MVLTSSLHADIESLVRSITGNITRQGIHDCVTAYWLDGLILSTVSARFHALLTCINNADKDPSLITEVFHAPWQVASTSTLLYDNDFAARLVHDSAESKSRYNSFKQYNIEPHYHPLDSILVVTSCYSHKGAEFILHDKRLGYDAVIRIPIRFGSIVFIPRLVSHTFLPSDNGLSTINITERYIRPSSPGFSFPSPCDFDMARSYLYADYNSLLRQKNSNTKLNNKRPTTHAC